MVFIKEVFSAKCKTLFEILTLPWFFKENTGRRHGSTREREVHIALVFINEVFVAKCKTPVEIWILVWFLKKTLVEGRVPPGRGSLRGGIY